MRKNRVFLGLGSNLGDRENYLRQAIRLLKEHPAIDVIQVSSVYETVPVGYVNQGPFLNMVAEIETTLNPFDLLEQTLRIENTLDRKREIHWGPRTIDVDILLFNQEIIEDKQLVIPHPRMMERAFVLIPLMEIAPELPVPGKGIKVKDLAYACPGKDGVLLKKAGL